LETDPVSNAVHYVQCYDRWMWVLHVTDDKVWNHIPPEDPRNPYTWNICGAKLSESARENRGHDVCWQTAGWQTDHPGVGRCKWHAGRSLVGVDHPSFQHGNMMTKTKQMREVFKKKAQAAEQQEDTLDLIGELELQRHLLYLFLARQSKHHNLDLPEDLQYDEQDLVEMLGGTRESESEEIPMPRLIEIVYEMIDKIVKTSTSISTQRKETVLTITEVKYLQNILRETFERFIPDVDTREEALRWFAERVGN